MPRAPGVRPTLDRVREALFSILGDRIADSVVLDLFAGSGALGIEALSRGARHAAFVDSRRACVRTVQENLKACGFEGRSTVLLGTVPACLPALKRRYGESYEVVFLDPPYRDTFDLRILEALEAASLLKRDAMIIIEHGRRQGVGDLPASFVVATERAYGDVAVTFLLHRG